jgi:hypothetical protein
MRYSIHASVLAVVSSPASNIVMTITCHLLVIDATGWLISRDDHRFK